MAWSTTEEWFIAATTVLRSWAANIRVADSTPASLSDDAMAASVKQDSVSLTSVSHFAASGMLSVFSSTAGAGLPASLAISLLASP